MDILTAAAAQLDGKIGLRKTCVILALEGVTLLQVQLSPQHQVSCLCSDGGPHLRKARESREGGDVEDREVARRGSRMAAASASSPSRAATLAGSWPSLYRRMTTSMMVFQPTRTLSPYLQAPGQKPESSLHTQYMVMKPSSGLTKAAIAVRCTFRHARRSHISHLGVPEGLFGKPQHTSVNCTVQCDLAAKDLPHEISIL